MFNDFKLTDRDRPAYIQVKDYLKRLILRGALQENQKLPSTREMSTLLSVSRNTVIAAYTDLEEERLLYAVPGKGSYVAAVQSSVTDEELSWQTNWDSRINSYARKAVELDRMKHGIRAGRGFISFTSIAPDEELFDLENVRRAFMDRMAIEGNVLLNYGYAKGYKPLIEYLKRYMEQKGVDLEGKDLLITSGFTEGFDIVLSALGRTHGTVLCENPTHHTAIKNLKLNGFEITGIEMEDDGLNLQQLKQALSERAYDCAYLVPSYHNPTGIVTSPARRIAVMKLLAEHQIPVIEDGFNEELRYSSSHALPLMSLAGQGNGVIYLGSFSKVLFPGMRVGWVLADRELVSYLESIKRARNIHTSTLDQSVLYQYLHNGHLDKYLKKARSIYKRKFEWTRKCCEQFIPFAKVSGDGGLHLFLKFNPDFDTHLLLEACSEQGVVFTPGDMFYTDERGRNTMRIGFSRVSENDIERGLRIIGRTAAELLGKRL
ncbi:PLP-dependent aminotransferase family protein [Paenibacillus sp. CAA11]|uniref:aminotransferase-like domain-containing protein n=1 Tax=Paenibacillus sp. CAA11 TaxID=1532905 RepID=UPI000D33AAB5|nr:PLP-dependent aminotransferase family protein [Paenibacillus sp. CAA11]AWB44671.1 PLP-dependent aminotransferase family protein [Paenibacillus sp. CAA11]